MNYARQPNPPEWWDNKDPLCINSTSGTSPSNEWYHFTDRASALEFIFENFHSQTYYDQFVFVGDEIYDIDDMLWSEEDTPLVKNNASPADLSEVIRAESRF
jgi:hypothetical protein